MKTLIVYASSHGTTEKVAQLIAKGLGVDNTDVVDLKKTPRVSIGDYDRVVVGGSIHAGKMQSKVKAFCKNNADLLLQRQVALYMCGLNAPELDKEFNEGYPEALRKHAVSCQQVGGEYSFDRMNFLEKLIVKKVAGVTASVSHIKYPNIEALIKEFSVK